MKQLLLPADNHAVLSSLRAALSDRFPQAILLTGQAGSGKMRLALWLASALLCTAEDGRPCGRCAACRKIDDRAHPDLIVVDEGDADLPVALARRLRQEASILPNEGARKIFILRHAHQFNVSAQNAMLKLLEEPPRYAFFLLTSEQPDALLETIRSRCARFQLAPPAPTASDEAEYLPALSGFAAALAGGDEFGMLSCAMQLEKLPRPVFQQALGQLQLCLRDAIFMQHGLPQPALSAINASVQLLSGRLTDRQMLELYDFLSTLSGRCEVNAFAAAQCAALSAGAFSICYPNRV